MDEANILAGYAADAPALIPAFEAISSPEVFAPVIDLLPAQACRVLDVGAGTGRDAAWFAAQEHRVVAVEPVDELRRAGIKLHASVQISWIDDRLPALERVRAIGDRFDLIVAVGVWQHVLPVQQPEAIAALARLAAPRSRLILSVRHGPGAATRPCFPCDPDAIVRSAKAAGLRLIRSRDAASIQQRNRDAGITWTWLAFERATSH